MSELDLARIQGFVVRGYRLPFARYLFLRIDDPERAATWIARASEEVMTAAPWSAKPASGINLAFSFWGLAALGLPDASLAGLPEEFRQGMAARAELLGDVGPSAPANWEAPLGSSEVHILVMISAMGEQALEAHEQRFRDDLERGGGLTLIYSDLGNVLPGGIEHFGFTDGFSQPSIEGAGLPETPGGGAPLGKGDWRAVRAGEFILGYLDEEGVLPTATPPDELSRNGSFLVYRKLFQDVAAFRARLAESAALFDGGEELLAAKLVGRWRDGTPLEVSPEHPDAAIVADTKRNNSFDYAGDPQGLRCPVGAHVRRANPRLSLPFDGELVNRHRLIRRGIPYGEQLASGASDDGEDRGVIFMCLQASIARQFEFIQSQWMHRGNSFGLGEDEDVINGCQEAVGQPGKLTVQGSPPFFVGPLSRVVTVKGGEYFFVPGVNGLQFLAAAAGGGAA